MKTLIHHACVIADGYREIACGGVLVENGRILALFEESEFSARVQEDCEIIDAQGGMLTPGFIDIHIHGAAGEDLISGKAEAAEAVSRNVAADGCTAFMASLTVVSHAQLLEILSGLAQVKSLPGAAMLGIHSEGPYLSPDYKALMDDRYLRDPSLKELQEMLQAAAGRLKIMTVAPERQGMESFIQAAVQSGMTVMVGHTAATSRDVHRASLAGAAGFTHLYNAMSQHLHRDPGTVTGAFLEEGMKAELIADGFHVDPEIVRMTWKHMGAQRLVLITDAMLGKGMPDGDFQFSGLHCRKQGQHVRVVETGRRAGSAIGMNDAVRMMEQMCGCTPRELVQMACVNPAALAQVSDHKGALAAGMDADLALFDKNWQCQRTMVEGNWVFQR